MKCKICGKEVIDKPYYEIDIYKYNQGLNLNYSHEITPILDILDKEKSK